MQLSQKTAFPTVLDPSQCEKGVREGCCQISTVLTLAIENIVLCLLYILLNEIGLLSPIFTSRDKHAIDCNLIAHNLSSYHQHQSSTHINSYNPKIN